MQRSFITLYEIIENKILLTAEQMLAFKHFIGKGLRAERKKRALGLMKPTHLVMRKNHEWFKRIYFNVDGRIELVAGQDYPSEFRTVRDLLLP